jgi:hypothetical protein
VASGGAELGVVGCWGSSMAATSIVEGAWGGWGRGLDWRPEVARRCDGGTALAVSCRWVGP